MALMNKSKINRGDVWLIDLDPTVGHEQAKLRPCVIISVDGYNDGPAGLFIVVPITSRFRPIPWYVAVKPPEGGLTKPSYVICDQVRSVSIERFEGSFLGSVSPQTMKNIDQRVAMLLNLRTLF
jgi:mRNA interferase MazF